MGITKKIKKALKQYIRVLKITSKPDMEEFKMSAQVTGIGILLIGAIGFLIYLIGNTLLY